ncbi:nitrogenase subunit molybdenum-iron protein alpha, partial [Escherichia coli]
MDKFFNFIEKGLSEEINFFMFSIDLEHYLVDHYEEMYTENKEATLYLNDL